MMIEPNRLTVAALSLSPPITDPPQPELIVSVTLNRWRFKLEYATGSQSMRFKVTVGGAGEAGGKANLVCAGDYPLAVATQLFTSIQNWR